MSSLLRAEITECDENGVTTKSSVTMNVAGPLTNPPTTVVPPVGSFGLMDEWKTTFPKLIATMRASLSTKRISFPSLLPFQPIPLNT
ncbi:hypothetical protein RJ640_014282 [Escallonia rubra]|uniref:Uncharacterized protein n=1 Tax=Escallonia rubra TaxID=112253 RepID=A0AA88U5S3_9ASTE|nr:hypothetical protein RJ640_014282 [Escallonia rubra]